MTIVVAKRFTDTLGGRTREDGKFSGEEFREEILKPAYVECKENEDKLIVDLDGCFGYPTSFLDEAFGGLYSEFLGEDIFSIITIKCQDQPGVLNKIQELINKRK